MELTKEQARLALQRAKVLALWLERSGTILPDDMATLVPVPAMLLRDLRKSLG